MFENHIIYDLETYPNIFTYCAIDYDGSNIRVYEISDRINQSDMLLNEFRMLYSSKKEMVGFNNIGFDYNIIHHILTKASKCKDNGNKFNLTAKELYNVAQKVIDSYKGDGFGIKVKENEMYIPQIDLYLINHFDNKAKITSLKTLEINMRSENVEDLPFPVGKTLTDNEKDILIHYNKHDVMETLKFYNHNLGAIKLRYDLTEKYGFNCINLNDGKIGGNFFMSKIEKDNPTAFYTRDEHGRKTMKQSKRDKIDIGECLFSYLRFSSDEFKTLHEWFSKQVITETKGVFSDIEEHLLGDLAKHSEMVTKSIRFKEKPTQVEVDDFLKIHPKGWIEERELKSTEIVRDENGVIVKEEYVDDKGVVKTRSKKVFKKAYYGCWRVAETLNTNYGGCRIDYGVGGLHSARQGSVHKTDTHSILSWDVASMYPNIAIANNVYPEHLGRGFCKSYEDFYNERKKFAKGTPENLAIKLGLNSTYGNSNNQYSPFYDPVYTMKITVNGQLSLSMLIEKIVDRCNAELVMANTDGFEVYIPNDEIDKANHLVSLWERITGLEMEQVEYQSMYIRDVNNYIAVYTNGGVKRKGAYVNTSSFHNGGELAYHQNHSALVIPLAVEHELLQGGCVEDFIRNHKDPFDFLLSTKVPRSSRLVLDVDGVDTPLQNVCRFYPSTCKGKLVKIMPPLKDGGEDRRLGIMKEWDVKVCNNMEDFTWEINYDYYISEAKKLLQPFNKIICK